MNAAIKIFKNRYQANKIAKNLVGWDYKIVRFDNGYAIACNGFRHYLEDGFIN